MFGGSLNVHPHLHTLSADGVFEKTGEGGVRLHEIPPPSPDDVAQVARRVRDRAVRWLGREGYIDRRAVEDRGNETPEPSAIEACTQLALAGGAFLARPREKGEDRHDGDADLDRKERRFSALCDGFDVHCAVRIAAGDDQGRERLVRYCTRPPFALDRIEVLGDGRIAYRVKTVRRGRTHRVMTPMVFMARLAALVPPARIPYVRYHGVFASRSSWRRLLTPRPPPQPPRPCATSAPAATVTTGYAPATTPTRAPGSVSPAPPAPAKAGPPPFSPPAPPGTSSVAQAEPTKVPAALAPVPPVLSIEPTAVTVQHWARLADGELFARARYIEWAVLMKRTWGFNVLPRRSPTPTSSARSSITSTSGPRHCPAPLRVTRHGSRPTWASRPPDPSRASALHRAELPRRG